MKGPDFVVGPVWSLDKRGGKVLAGEREYKGARFFEVRHWASEGTIATKHGVTIPPGEVASLGHALLNYAKSLSERDKLS